MIEQAIIDFVEWNFTQEEQNRKQFAISPDEPYQGVDFQQIFAHLAENKINLSEAQLAEKLDVLIQDKKIKYTQINLLPRLIAYTSIKANYPKLD